VKVKLELHDDQIFVDADEEVSNILQLYNYSMVQLFKMSHLESTSLQCMYMLVVVLLSNNIFILCHLVRTVFVAGFNCCILSILV